MRRTFETLARYLPPNMITLLLERKGLSSVSQLEHEFCKNTFFIPAAPFEEARRLANTGEGAQAFFSEGFSFIRSRKQALPANVMFVLLHEWVHAADYAAGFERSPSAREALAYGLDLYISRKTVKHNLRKRTISSTAADSEYLRGFALGKRIAMDALELNGKLGETAVKKFFTTLFTNASLNPTFVEAVKQEILKK